MSDRPRQVPHAAPRDLAEDAEAADRESRVEQLLLAGLDQYFAGRFDQAIDIWTRVAFLDRRNTRAKAYIDRARGLVAERQREVEALVHEGVAAYHAGDLAVARTLLTAPSTGAATVTRRSCSSNGCSRASRCRRRRRRGAAPSGTARRAGPQPAVWSWLATAPSRRVWRRPSSWPRARSPRSWPSCQSPCPRPPRWPRRRCPSRWASDRVLARARTLHAQGRAAEALRLLAGGGRGRCAAAGGRRAARGNPAGDSRPGRRRRQRAGGDPMKCPKCLYIGFETGDRCKNCGYDFSLLAQADDPPAGSRRSAAAARRGASVRRGARVRRDDGGQRRVGRPATGSIPRSAGRGGSRAGAVVRGARARDRSGAAHGCRRWRRCAAAPPAPVRTRAAALCARRGGRG